MSGLESKFRQNCREAIKDFDKSGALATSEVSDHLRHAYFRAGYLAACKKQQEDFDETRIDDITEVGELLGHDLSGLFDFNERKKFVCDKIIELKKGSGSPK